MMIKARSVAGVFLAAALSLGTAAHAGDLGECLNQLDAFFGKYDTRTESPSHYYFDKEDIEGDQGIRSSIKTAVKTGRFESDLNRLSELNKMSGIAVTEIVNTQFALCRQFGSFEKIPEDKRMGFAAKIPAFVAAQNEMMAIIKKLEAAGREMIANGTPPVPKDEFVPLFP